METCLLKRFINGEFITFTCDEVRNLHLQWKKEFREKNGTDQILAAGVRDRMYEEFVKSVDSFLYEKCKCNKIPLKCDRCLQEDHEGFFCRCESRNINLAKQLRSEKEM